MHHIQSYNSLKIKRRMRERSEKKKKKENRIISYALDILFSGLNAHFKWFHLRV